jgi:hypothetical protein
VVMAVFTRHLDFDEIFIMISANFTRSHSHSLPLLQGTPALPRVRSMWSEIPTAKSGVQNKIPQQLLA